MATPSPSRAHPFSVLGPWVACAAAAAVLAVGACGGPLEDGSPHGADHDSERDDRAHLHERGDGSLYEVTLADRAEVERAFEEGRMVFDPPRPVRQVSLMFDAPEGTTVEWRPRREDGRPGPWRPVEVTWSENESHVARALLDAPAPRIELRSSQPLAFAYIEFSEHITARTSGPLTRDLPRVGTEDLDGEYRTTRQLEAPRSLVIPRSDWGARDPDKICGSQHNPYRMTIHHTASPDSDGGDPAARMREMQAFHIDNRGWCDIGYHFVVSQSGKVFQGRSTENRTGAHVGGENSGNIGIAHIGNFEQQTVGTDQFEASTRIVHWIHETYGISLDRQSVKGHTEWPGQNTSCPGTNLLNRLDELLQKSENPGGSDNTWDVQIETTIVDGTNPYTQGSSGSIPDAFPGDSLQAEMIVTNASPDPIRDVFLGYVIQSPYLEGTDYTIYDDHPEHDQSSWEVNDSNSASGNPATLGSEGELNLFAFSPGESKRIVLNIRAKQYSIGAIHHPDMRGWVQQIRDVYQTKEGWDDTPSTNEVGRDLRDFADMDVLSRNEWRFENSDTPENLEGWTGCCTGAFEQLELNQEAGAMAMRVTGPDPKLESPEWTRIDASTYDEMVLRVRSHDGSHPKAIYWRREGESFADARSFRFEAPGDGDFHTMVVPLGTHSDWSGTIRQLRIDPLDSGEAPASGAEGWYDVDGIYFRSSASGETTTEREPYSDGTVVEPLDPSETDETDDSDADGGAGSENIQPRTPAGEIEVKGCTAAGGSSPAPGSLVALTGIALVTLRRRSFS